MKIAKFALGFIAVVFLAVMMNNRARALTEADPGNVLLTSAGALPFKNATVTRLLQTYFPGYDDYFASHVPLLREDSEFCVPAANFADLGPVAVKLPYKLIFQLISFKRPDVLIFGSSRAIAAVRPDVVSKGLGGKCVINLAMSAAGEVTIESLLNEAMRRVDGEIDTIVLFVEDIGFAASTLQNGNEWRERMRDLSTEDTVQGKINHLQNKMYEKLPSMNNTDHTLRLPYPPSAGVCADEASIQAELSGPLQNSRWYAGGPADEHVAAFERNVKKIRARARHVVFVDPPVTHFQEERARSIDFHHVVAKSVGRELLPRDMKFWNVTERDYFGSYPNKPCKLDYEHINPAAAVRFSTRLAEEIAKAHQ